MSIIGDSSVTQSSRHLRIDRAGLAFAILGLCFGAIFLLLGEGIQRSFGGMSTLTAMLPVGYAFAAGMVATVNPCGVLLLPSLVAYSIGKDAGARRDWTSRLEHGVLRAVMATLGFVAIFAAVGLIFAAGGRALGSWFPAGGVAVGVALLGLGLWLVLTDRSVGLLAASRAMGYVSPRQDLGSLFLFGIGYAIASLGCTLPVFLVVVGLALASSDLLFAVSQFVSYALGMGLVLTVVVLGATFFQGAIHRWLRTLVPYVHRLAAAFLVGAGVYLIDYWLRAAGLLG